MCRPCFASSTPSPEASFTCCQYHAKIRTLGCIFCVCRHSTTSRAFSNVCSVERHWELLRCGQRTYKMRRFNFLSVRRFFLEAFTSLQKGNRNLKSDWPTSAGEGGVCARVCVCVRVCVRGCACGCMHMRVRVRALGSNAHTQFPQQAVACAQPNKHALNSPCNPHNSPVSNPARTSKQYMPGRM